MKKLWFTADQHFGHANIIKYCNRPFSSVEEMDEVMIQRWNEKVKPDDDIYCIGDFTLGDNCLKYANRLNGRIFFIPGSHDHRWLADWSYAQNDGLYNVYPSLYTLEINHHIFVLCHYAMRVWDRSHYGTFHLYGHSHGHLPGIGRSMDVGVDTNNFYPYSLDEIVERLSKIEPHNAPKH